MFVSATPVTVNKKIRGSQPHKPRLTLQAYYDFTDIRSINLANTPGITSSSASFGNLSPEKLVERSQDLRLGRLPATPTNVRSSFLPSTSVSHQQSSIWPNYASAILSPSTGHAPDVPARTTRAHTTARPAVNDQQNSFVHVEPRNRSFARTKTYLPKANARATPKGKSSLVLSRSQPLAATSQIDYSRVRKINAVDAYESARNHDHLPVLDSEYDDYLEKAMIKCADWLIRYVFDKTYENIVE